MSRRRKALVLGGGALAAELAGTWLSSRRVGGRMIVRCRDRHLFETIWIPGASLKALRLGRWRLQRCPVGRHWTIVVPVNETKLTAEELHEARAHRDLPIP